MSYIRVPYYLIVAGFLFAGILLAEILAVTISEARLPLIFVANVVSSLPFIVVLILGGYWALESELSPERYRRMGGWTITGFAFFLSFFSLIAIVTMTSWPERVAVLRWAGAVGAGSGFLVGLFEAKAIDRLVVAERTRARNEALRRQNERLEQFANIIAHDLRNPLQVASGHVETVREDVQSEHLDTAVTALARMEEIIEETLTLARSGQRIDELSSVELADLVDRCWHNVETERATLEVERSSTIRADQARVQHLLENAFRNAVEHGGPDVTVRVGTLSNGFYVEDDGPGIPAAERDAVLEVGYSTRQDGSGFGLAIVQEIVNAHGWELSVTESAEGGARFEVRGVDMQPSAAPATPTVET